MRRVAGLRQPRARWRAAVTVAGVIIVGGAAAIAKWPHAWWWLILITAAAAAMSQPALAAAAEAGRRRHEAVRTTRIGLQQTTGSNGAVLPLAGRADLEARVHRTVLTIPYIHRDHEQTIRDHLTAGRPVLLVGSSMVGKTRMAARVITDTFGSWPSVIPDSKTALADLDAQDVSILRSIVWLDDLDRLIGAGGITDGALRRVAAAGNVIIATIRAAEYDRFQPTDRLRPPEWDVISVFERIFIIRDLSEREQKRLDDAISDPGIRARIREVGLGEYVGAAGQISETLKLGAAGTGGLGYAMVLAAADWRRCGLTRPIPVTVLLELAAPHLDSRHRNLLADRGACAAGIAWATREINPNVSLLQPTGADAYNIYDYALDLITAQNPAIPDSNWDVVINNADPSELLAIAYTAETTYQRTSIAIHANRKAVTSGGSAAALAAFNIGVMLYQQGDDEGAQEAYTQAIDSADTYAAPLALINLGVLLAKHGESAKARAAYQQAIDSGHAEAAPSAASCLGSLLEQQGDVDGARAAYQEAIDSGHADVAPGASNDLGALLEDQGDVDGARAAYQQAIDSGHADEGPRAVVNLGMLLAGQEDVDRARAAYQQAIDSGHADEGPRAAACLGSLQENQGDVDGARAAYQQAIDSGHADEAPRAMVSLAMLLADQGDVDGARAAYQQAIDSGHAFASPMAAGALGALLEDQGDVDGARAAYQQAIESGEATAAALAADALQNLLKKQDDTEGKRGTKNGSDPQEETE